MKNFIKSGKTITVPAAPYARSSGQGVLQGTMFGVCSTDVALSGAVEVVTEGVFDLTKATGQAWTVGAALYWDDTAKNVTTTSSANTKIGVAAAVQASGDTVGRVRLNGSF